MSTIVHDTSRAVNDTSRIQEASRIVNDLSVSKLTIHESTAKPITTVRSGSIIRDNSPNIHTTVHKDDHTGETSRIIRTVGDSLVN